MKQVDVIIIGAGIIGSFIAHNLSNKECSILVLEKNADVADGATMANSAIVHSGHDPKPGTLKALLNVRGNRMYKEICEKLGVSYQPVSSYVVATDETEQKTLDVLYAQALEREIPVKRITGEQARKEEPNLADSIIEALELPTTAIVYPWEVAIALMEEAVLNGTELHLEEAVTGISKTDQGNFLVRTGKDVYESRYVVNAAGIYADIIYQMALTGCGMEMIPEFSIKPRRGEYYVLDKMKEPLVSRVIYPVPGPSGKGVLVVPTTHGNVLLGPNAENIEDRDAVNTTAEALSYVKQNVCKTVKNIPFDKVIRTFAGLRPGSDVNDFVIEQSAALRGFVNVACIESPGLASAPAIAEYVCDMVMKEEFAFPQKEKYCRRTPVRVLKAMETEEKNRLVKENPDYGRIVCRCEQVSKGEIIDAIRRPVGAKSVKGVKKRVRPGMGRCQGGFCEPAVVEILAEELGISPLDVRLAGSGSVMLMEEMKGEVSDEAL